MLIQLDKVGADNHLESVVIPEAGVPNGALVQLGDFGDYDTIKGLKVTDVTEPIVMIVEEFMNRTGVENETDMVFKKDFVARGYHFVKGDIVTVTIDGIEGATNVVADMKGKFVVPQVGKYLGKVNATASGSLCFKVMNVESLFGQDALVIKVV
jgi:hypothetical protein